MFIKSTMEDLTEIIDIDRGDMSETEVIEMFKQGVHDNIKMLSDYQDIPEIVVEHIAHPGDKWLNEQIVEISAEINQLTAMKNRYEGLLMGRNRNPIMHHSV